MNIYLTEYKSYDGLIYAGPKIKAENERQARTKTFDKQYWMYGGLRVVGELIREIGWCQAIREGALPGGA